WEASVAAGGDVLRAADGLEAPPVGRLAFLFFTPPRTCCFHISQAPQAKQTNRPVATVMRKLRWWPEPWKGHTARTTWPPAGGPFDSSICRKENSVVSLNIRDDSALL